MIRSFQRDLANENNANQALERIQIARYVLQVLTILITLAFWYAHARKQPFPQHAQNSLESALFFVTALVLLFGIIYSALLRSLINVDLEDTITKPEVNAETEPASGEVTEEEVTSSVPPLHERINALCASSISGEIVSLFSPSSERD